MADSTPPRLLLLACSGAKRHTPELLPAVERYDGPAFRVLRRFRHLRPESPLDVLILSAEFGLIGEHEPIPAYDRTMTTTRADEFRRYAVGVLRQLMGIRAYGEVFISMSELYKRALVPFVQWVPNSTHLIIGRSDRGIALTDLRAWLYENQPTMSAYDSKQLRRRPHLDAERAEILRP